MKTTILLFLTVSARALGVDFAVPASNGNSGTAYPFRIDSMRYQQVYGAEAFSSLAPVGGGWITAIQFRNVSGDFGLFSSVNAQINFSTTTLPVDGLSATFAENIGSDEQTVLGPGEIQFFADHGPLRLVQPFLTLATPFFYDPAEGNLLMDVRMFRGISGFEPPEFDASDHSTDLSSRVAAFDRDGLTGNASTVTLVTGFRFTAVPEPSFAVLAAAALAALSLFRLRHKSSTRKE